MAAGRDVQALAAVFAVSGVVHLLKPEAYEPIMPRFVPRHREVVYASGVAELACAAGLLGSRTRTAAGWASVVLLLGIYPANLKMAVDAAQTDRTGFKAVALGRLPFQLPMIRTAYRAARGRTGAASRP